MMVGNLLIYGAVATSLGSTAVLAYAATRDEDFAEWGRYLVFATAAFLVSAFGWLTYQFLSTDYTNSYVWGHTADYLANFYRMTGTFAGVNGSLLLWAALVAVFVAWLVRSIPDREHALVATIGAAVTAVFAVMAMNRSPFQEIAFELGRTVYGPRGLNPLLINPYMGIHPPITFAGYALTVPIFAIAVTHFIKRLQGEDGMFKRWLPQTMGWLRLSWIMLTGAVALGAIWSYNTLGWGGLWAWDPVETAVLVSWLIVSMAAHAVANFRRRGQNSLLAPALAAITFPGVVFARLITQSGTSPLHSFGVGLSELLLVLLLVSTVLSVVPPLFLWLKGDGEGEDLDENLLTLGNLLYLSILVIGVLTFISLWGIGLPAAGKALGNEFSVGVNFYNLWSYPVAVVMLLLLGLYNDYVANGRRSLRMFGAVTVVTLVVAVIPMEGWQIAPDASGLFYSLLGQVNALVLFPPVAYVLLGVSDRLMTVIPKLNSRSEKFALSGRGLVHVGLALILVAAPFTYLFATSASGMVPASTQGMGQMQLGDSAYSVEMANYQSELQPTVAKLTAEEDRVLSEAVREVAMTPAQVEGTDQNNAIVTGTISGVQSNSPSVSVRLDGTTVWVPIGEFQNADSLVGATIWAQGPVNTTQGATWVESSTLFVGRTPTDAIIPQNRMVRRTADITVYKNGQAVTSGQAGMRNHLGYGSVSEIMIHKGLLVDTYVAPQQYQTVQGQPAMYVMVKQIPLMNLVRLGIALMLIGGFLIYRFDPGSADDWE